MSLRQAPKKRKQRFTDPELHKLVDTVLPHVEQLFGPNALDTSGKAEIWDKVVEEVNKVGGKKRRKEQCKKRWLDYKWKVQQMINRLKAQSPKGDQMLRLSGILHKRQIMVAKFYKMDASDGQKSEIQDESLSDIGDDSSSEEEMLTPSNNFEHEDEFVPSHNTSFPSSSCTPSTSHQDKSIFQSYKMPPASRWYPPNNRAVHMSIPPHFATQSQNPMESQLDQLISQQRNNFEVLQQIQENVTASLNIQNAMYNLVESNFLELHRTLLFSQKARSGRSNVLELGLNNIHAKLDEMNSLLREKQLQEIMSSEEFGFDQYGASW